MNLTKELAKTMTPTRLDWLYPVLYNSIKQIYYSRENQHFFYSTEISSKSILYINQHFEEKNKCVD